MDLSPEKLRNLLREVKTIKAYSTRVEGMLEEVLAGVGTGPAPRKTSEAKKDKMRLEIKAKFLRPYNKKATTISK